MEIVRRKSAGIGLACGVLLSVISAQHAVAGPVNVPSADELRNAEWIKAGRSRFVRTCAYCHGQRGEGGKNDPFEEREKWDPVEIFTTISEGRIAGANAMPSWKESFKESEIWELVAYIKSLSKDFPGPITSESPASAGH